MELAFTGIEFASDSEAVQFAEAGGGKAIRLAGKPYVVSEIEADRIAALGVEFCYLFDAVDQIGRPCLMIVPVND